MSSRTLWPRGLQCASLLLLLLAHITAPALAGSISQEFAFLSVSQSGGDAATAAGSKTVENSGYHPGGREGAWMVADPTNRNFWYYGGNQGGNKYADLWRWSTSTGNWAFFAGTTAVNQQATYSALGLFNVDNKPGSRTQHGIAVSTGLDVYVFFGYGMANGASTGLLGDM